MKINSRPSVGFSLVELLIAMVIGLFLVGAATAVFVAQAAISKTTVSQAQIQNAANALAALVGPIIRGAGFTGCSNLGEVISTLNTSVPASGPALLNAIAGGSAAMVAGFEANGLGGNGTVTLPQINAANAPNSSSGDWTPALESTIAGKTQRDSDVLIVLGAVPGFSPLAVTSTSTTSDTTLSVKDTSKSVFAASQYAAVTDCAKTTIFQITSFDTTHVSHAAGTGALANTSDYLPVPYGPAAQLVGLQLTALFVAHGDGDQSVLMRSTYQNGQWNDVPLVPGIDNMQILYGIGDGTSITNYLSADAVNDWTKVNAIRLGFLIEGDKGTGPTNAPTSYTLLGTQINVPNDGRLRHMVEMTINLRNAS